MSGSTLDEFTTLMNSQGSAWVSGPEHLINEATLHTYTLPRVTSGNSMMDMVQGGDQITDTIFLDVKGTYRRYNPNESFNYRNPQTGTTWTRPWAFGTAHISWNKQEVGLNKEKMTGKYRAQKYKKVMTQKRQNMWTDVCNSIEAEFWAQPDYDTMEAATVPTGQVRAPMSIPCVVNEFTNGVPAGWTGNNIQTIDASANAAWRPYQGTYTYSSASAATTRPLFAALSKAMHSVRFERLPKHGEYSDSPTDPRFIACSLTGMVNYEEALRGNQDEFRGMGKTSGQDPHYDGPTFRGVELVYLSTLDNASLYDDGSSGFEQESAANFTGPRYYIINGSYLRFYVHDENYCVMEEALTPTDKPFSRVMNMDLWNNTAALSRRRHGILSPSANTVNAAA